MRFQTEEYAQETQQELKNTLEAAGVPYQSYRDRFEIQGASVTVRHNHKQVVWVMRIDPGTAEKNLEVASKLSKALCGPEAEGMSIKFIFATDVYCEMRSHIRSGKLSGIATLAPNLSFRQGDLNFKVDREQFLGPGTAESGSAFLVVGSPTSVPSLGAVRDIISTLFEKGILHFDPDLISV
jgi:hypothetical protein